MSERKRRGATWRTEPVPIWRAPSSVACRGEDTSLFYKGEGEGETARQGRTAKARALCQACCLRAECLEAAMAEERRGGGRFGIRGGLTEQERKDLQTSRTLKARRAAERAALAAAQEGGEETGNAA